MSRSLFGNSDPGRGRLTDPGRQVKELLNTLLSQHLSTVRQVLRKDCEPPRGAVVNGITIEPLNHPLPEIDGRLYGIACVGDARVPLYLEDGELRIGTKGEIRNPFYDTMESILAISDYSPCPPRRGGRGDLLRSAYRYLADPSPARCTERSSCFACGGSTESESSKHHLSQVEFSRCATCGLVERVGVDDSLWAQAYGDVEGRYFRGLYSDDTAYVEATASAHGYEDYEEWVRVILGQEHFDRRARQVASVAPNHARRALDVGCATGELTAALHRLGYQTTGVDPSQWAIASARLKFRELRFQCERIEELGSESFNIITLMDVFEHLSDPCGTLNRFRSILSAGGVLMLELPNQASLDAKILDSDYLFPEHLYFYTPRSISQLLVQAGYTVVALASEHDHYFRVDTLVAPPDAARLRRELRGERLLVFARRTR